MKITPIVVSHKFIPWDISSYLSQIIKLVTWCKWNHSALRIDHMGYDLILEARSSGVYLSTFDNWLKHRPYKEWKEMSCTIPDPENLTFEIFHRLGNLYDVPSLFAHLIYKITGLWLSSKTDSKENCSELISDIYGVPEAYLQTTGSLIKNKILIDKVIA